MVEQNLVPKERNKDWIRALMNSSFGYCDDHHDLRSNEKNVFCVDCGVRLCRHCKEAHSLHRRFQIYKYSSQDVFRHSELQKYFDCTKIQTYVSNNERIVHLKPRPSTIKSKSADLSPESKSKETNISTRPKSGGTCEQCGKHIQDDRNRFCSITCKISVLPVEPQNQTQIHHSQRSSAEPVNQSARCIITPKPEPIDFNMNDNHNSEAESSISEAEPYGCVEVVNFRKRPRKTTPQRPIFVYIS
ncbi:protein RGF1 INDUCIBLE TRANSCRIPTION FACTOR 1-like [Gastrolobium bilobum]|uniref:protein RGF1 INDUCIBLE TRANSCRIPTION FACTOR 1-like n=1 Tax=Gastrolobium bilobum TaxID=150636 RepID=UPI002AB1C6FC|nr:protein RGF1 INDUCIBLE TRANSCRIPTION FACTOR 1-like [Gastrolobium bilobum]